MANPRRHWIDKFLHHLRTERRLSDNTCKHYQRDLLELLDWCEKAGLKHWRDLDTRQVRHYAARCHRRGLSGRSIQRRLSALRSFYNYLLREQAVTLNPGLDVPAPKSKQHLPDTLSVDDIANLLNVSSKDTLALRDLAMLELMYSSGLRLSELVGLNSGDVDFDDRTVRVTGKGAKTRVLPVGDKAIKALRAWQQVRPRAVASGSGRVRYSSVSRTGHVDWVFPATCTRTPCGTPSPATCWSPAVICVPCRNCSVMRTSALHRSIPILISSTLRRSTTAHTHAPANQNKRKLLKNPFIFSLIVPIVWCTIVRPFFGAPTWTNFAAQPSCQSGAVTPLSLVVMARSPWATPS